MRGNFENTGKLVKLILRRERVISAIWIVIITLFSIGLAPALGNIFDSQSRETLIEMLKNPAMIAMQGPAYGIENYTVGAMYSNMMLLWVVITVAIMNIFMVIRHTRGDEERGRIEVIRSLPTGRLANLNAAMIAAMIINTVLALLNGLGVAALGIESMDLAGSVLYGVALGVSGMFFAALTALFAQLSSSSRGATGFSFALLFAFYIMRAAGDINGEILSLISPLGLVQRTQIYVENYAMPIVFLLIETAVIAAVTYALNAIRDMDQGFIHAKPGRSEASPLLKSRSGFGLAWRLTRNMIIAWTASIYILGAAYGSILGDIDEFVASSEFYAMIIGLNPDFNTAQMFVSMIIFIIALCSVAAVLMTVLKLRGEEKDGRAEHIISRAVSRTKYMSGYVILAFAGSIFMQLASALGIYSAGIAVLPDPGELTLGYLIKANMVYLPALWVMIGIAVLVIGILPKATAVIWGYFGFTFFAAFIGRMPDILPEWFVKLTPFGYIPQLPADEINYATLAVLTVIAVAFTAAGFIFYNKRDTQA